MFDPTPLRQQFPALQQRDDQGRPFIFFDGPGGTQVPQQVIDAMAHYYTHANANTHGEFLHSRRSDAVIAAGRLAMADFLNAASTDEIVFGPSATNLAFNVSRAIGATLASGDEIIVTRLDHDANIAPWLALQERGVTVHFCDFDVEDCTLNLNHFHSLLNTNTKLVAVGWASNAVGTVNPVAEIAAAAHNVGAKVWVDAVHYAPHFPIDVQAADIDFLMCSAYKFFGPHLGVLWSRYDLLDALPAYKVRPAQDVPPHKFEQGTGQFEAWAGTTAAIDYLAELGSTYGQPFAAGYEAAGFGGRRLALKTAMRSIAAYEAETFRHLLTGLQTIPGVHIYGLTSEAHLDKRTPTIAFRKDGTTPEAIAKALGAGNIAVWHGHYYAIEVVKRLGLYEQGGMVRVGLVHYNTPAEIDRLLEIVEHC